MKFVVTPTSLGTIVEAVVGDKVLIIRDDINGIDDDSPIKVIFGFSSQFAGSFEKELEVPAETTNEQLIKMFPILMEVNYDEETCYINIKENKE